MFRNTYQSGLLSIFYSLGSKPLGIWGKQAKIGQIKLVTDDITSSKVLELTSDNVAVTYIYTPLDPRSSLAIKLPFFIILVKNLNRYFTFEITVLDDKDTHRRFRMSNYLSSFKKHTFGCSIPFKLNQGWTQLMFNLVEFTWRVFNTNYVETVRVQIHANCRIKRVYFAEKLLEDHELPNEYQLMPDRQKKKPKKDVPETNGKRKLSLVEEFVEGQERLTEDHLDKKIEDQIKSADISKEEPEKMAEDPDKKIPHALGKGIDSDGQHETGIESAVSDAAELDESEKSSQLFEPPESSLQSESLLEEQVPKDMSDKESIVSWKLKSVENM